MIRARHRAPVSLRCKTVISPVELCIAGDYGDDCKNNVRGAKVRRGAREGGARRGGAGGEGREG